MKKMTLILIAFCFVIQTTAFDKLSLVERFTNASCVPCAALNNAWYNVTTQNLVNTGAISHLVYNVNWPGPNDPMYLLNSTDNMTRRTYYGVSWVPWPLVNAVYFDYQTQNQTQFINRVNTGNAEYAPFNIEITQEALSDNLIQVGIKIIRDPNDVTTFGNVKLRLALTESTVSFASPPGSNGERDFFSICRKMLPNAGGSTFTIPAPGEFVELSLQYIPTAPFLQSVDLDSLRFVAFIQDDGTKQILQSNMLMAIPNFVAQILPTSPDIISTSNTISEYTAELHNNGVMNDTYDITCNFDSAPVEWTGEFTTSNGTFQFGQSNMIQVASGEFATITVTVNPNSTNGAGEARLEFSSQNNPGLSGSVVFRTVTSYGVEMLVVDASGEGFGSSVMSSLSNVFTGTHGMVSRSALTPGIDLTNFYEIIWSAGISVPAFYPEEVTALQSFLDDGGRLLINGQDIGKDIFEATGQSQFAQDFYHNYLNAEFITDNGLSYLLNGFAGDPITNGMQFVLNDVYERVPDEITPYDADATAIFKFLNGPRTNSIRAETVDYRVVYFGFGFEQITELAIRDTLIARSIFWLKEGLVVGTPGDEQIVRTFSLEQNYPNPFNPSTTINYSLEKDVHVSLKVYDIMGSEVTELVNTEQSAGTYNVQFDASSVASGTYFYKLSAGDFVSVKKMTLLK